MDLCSLCHNNVDFALHSSGDDISDRRCLRPPLTWRSLLLWESHGSLIIVILIFSHFHHQSTLNTHITWIPLTYGPNLHLFWNSTTASMQVLHFWSLPGLFVCAGPRHPGQRPPLPRLCTQHARKVVFPPIIEIRVACSTTDISNGWCRSGLIAKPLCVGLP